MRLSWRQIQVPFRPLRPATHGAEPALRPLVVVELTASDGACGHGEAAPLVSYDGVSVQRTLAALARYADVLATADGLTQEDQLAACAQADPLPQALAAIDLALWDLAGKRAAKPVWQLLGGHAGGRIPVNATIGALGASAAAREAAAAEQAGFHAIKVKVGTDEDEGRLAAVRAAAGPRMLVRVDANGVWTESEAPERIRDLTRFGIELFEEPVRGYQANASLASHLPDVTIALDESGRDDPNAYLQRGCAAVCLKISGNGGITGVLAAAGAARAAGYQVYLASTLDGLLGIAAALQVAIALGPDRHCGLATLDHFAWQTPLRPEQGMMSAPAGTGLGDGLIDWYRPAEMGG
ncbi:MAG: mandelate racemase/muconate lactonizing enzyme family protein [Solirubrobacteraceae bacterium]